MNAIHAETKLSVVMPCYNSQRFLRESIDSILGQTYHDFEFIIWNDGSTDDTEAIILSYDDPRIRYFSAPNQGLGAARRAVCQEARGEYIATLDSDDISYPERLEKEVAFLDSHPDYILVGSLADVIDEEGHFICQSIMQCTDKALKKRADFYNSSSMFRRDAYLKAGGYLNLRFTEDVVLWGRMAKYGKYANLPEPLIRYRIQQMSAGRKLRQRNYLVCMGELMKKIINDETVDPKDVELLNAIWRQNVETSKRLPHVAAKSYVNMRQQSIFDFGSKIIGKRNMTRLMCSLKSWLVAHGIL